ncbi:MAG: DUF5681 domain-containing protein [Sphingomonadales bacterium]
MTSTNTGRRGRSKGPRNTSSILKQVLDEKHLVTDQDGKRERRTALELLLEQLRNKAIGGNQPAFKLMEQLLNAGGASVVVAGYLVVPETLPLEEWVKREEVKRSANKSRRND